jgi:hypothetical protein
VVTRVRVTTTIILKTCVRMLSFRNPYTVRIDLRTGAGPQSQSDSQTYELPFTDVDGTEYKFTGVTYDDPEENNFSVTGLAGDLNVHRPLTSAIVYDNTRGYINMTCEDEDWNKKYFDINNTTMLVIQEWFAQFNRNGEDSWMPQCTRRLQTLLWSSS